MLALPIVAGALGVLSVNLNEIMDSTSVQSISGTRTTFTVSPGVKLSEPVAVTKSPGQPLPVCAVLRASRKWGRVRPVDQVHHDMSFTHRIGIERKPL